MLVDELRPGEMGNPVLAFNGDAIGRSPPDPSALTSTPSKSHTLILPRRSSSHPSSHTERTIFMLYTIAVILIVLWLLGLVTSYTMSGFIHVLLVIAIVVVLIRLIQGRNPIGGKA
jgi:hypothetical protein